MSKRTAQARKDREVESHKAAARPRRASGASSIDIVLLGLIKEQPLGAYDVSQVIQQRQLRSWIKISDASVYRNLRILAEQGFLDTRVTREGAMPEKTIFELTVAGSEHLSQLIREAAAAPLKLHFEFDVWLGHLGLIGPAEATECREMLGGQLDALTEELGLQLGHYGKAMPPAVRSLLELRSEVLGLTRRWLDDFPLHPSTGAD